MSLNKHVLRVYLDGFYFQEDRGITEQDATAGSLAGSRTRPARGPGQPGGGQSALSPISAPPKNPQPTMGVKRKNDSKLPNEETVSCCRIQYSDP